MNGRCWDVDEGEDEREGDGGLEFRARDEGEGEATRMGYVH